MASRLRHGLQRFAAVAAPAPVRFALKVRHPAWARDGVTVDVNGARAAASTQPSSYVTVHRDWRDGDVVTVRFPMGLRLEELPGDPRTVALLYGPVVLAGDYNVAPTELDIYPTRSWEASGSWIPTA